MRNFLAVGVLLLAGTWAAAADWPQWLGPRRDSGSTEVVKPWNAPLKILWKQAVGEGHGGPVVAKGKVYLHVRTPNKAEETLAVFEADTGNPVWTTSYPRKETKILFGNGPRSEPCVVAGKVYTFGITGILTCFDAGADKILWQVDTAADYKAPSLFFGCSCSPIVVGDHVIVNIGAKGASIVAFDKNTGKEAWKKLDDRASYSSPIAIGTGDNTQVIFLTAGGLASLAPKDGKVFWQYPLVDRLSESSTTPVVIDDILFGSSVTFGGLALQMENGKAPSVKKLWTNSDLNCYFATPVAVGKDNLYMVTGSGSLLSKSATLRCIEAKSGKELWSRGKVGTYHASLLRTGDGKLLLVEEKGELALLDPNPKEYRELARTKICGNTWAHPALANGRLYIRDAKDLICVEMPK